ncbi:hypothetical protein CMI37_35300 [Candidatus Pacearchaeota archaeon]|nr:hypothetical protein [Candidatus Pacearchaeota archaeon]|tara:strand:+ start:2356 stop:2781 length:426 start_codon:yes stop_codon:yes gene_type:complete
MEAKTISQEKNPFLNREEITLEIKSEAVPSVEEVKKQINKEENLVVVKKVNSNFGTQTFTAEVFVYDSPEARKKIETIPKKIRNKIKEEEKQKAGAEKTESTEQKPEQPAEEENKEPNKPEEKPAEEPAEEPETKQEQKTE